MNSQEMSPFEGSQWRRRYADQYSSLHGFNLPINVTKCSNDEFETLWNSQDSVDMRNSYPTWRKIKRASTYVPCIQLYSIAYKWIFCQTRSTTKGFRGCLTFTHSPGVQMERIVTKSPSYIHIVCPWKSLGNCVNGMKAEMVQSHMEELLSGDGWQVTEIIKKRALVVFLVRI